MFGDNVIVLFQQDYDILLTASFFKSLRHAVKPVKVSTLKVLVNSSFG